MSFNRFCRHSVLSPGRTAGQPDACPCRPPWIQSDASFATRTYRGFYNFDLIIGMDDRNIDDLKDRAPSTAEWSKIHRMTEYCTKFTHADHVPDPITAVPKVLSMCWTFWKMLVRGYCRAFNPAALHDTVSPALTSCSVFQAS